MNIDQPVRLKLVALSSKRCEQDCFSETVIYDTRKIQEKNPNFKHIFKDVNNLVKCKYFPELFLGPICTKIE